MKKTEENIVDVIKKCIADINEMRSMLPGIVSDINETAANLTKLSELKIQHLQSSVIVSNNILVKQVDKENYYGKRLLENIAKGFNPQPPQP